PFTSRAQFKKVVGLGPAAFEQAAGFLKIAGGKEPLDNTFIHPESYDAARALLARLPNAGEKIPERVRAWRKQTSGTQAATAALAQELGIGAPTLSDILDNLEKPGLDPRDALPRPILRQDVLKLEDLKPGMILQGTVRNVVDFGAFVDIGVKQDGLVHISEMADHFVRDPHTIVAVGQVTPVRVLSVDTARGRIQLSMRGVEENLTP